MSVDLNTQLAVVSSTVTTSLCSLPSLYVAFMKREAPGRHAISPDMQRTETLQTWIYWRETTVSMNHVTNSWTEPASTFHILTSAYSYHSNILYNAHNNEWPNSLSLLTPARSSLNCLQQTMKKLLQPCYLMSPFEQVELTSYFIRKAKPKQITVRSGLWFW